MHAFGFVHKNIRPENILMLKTLEAPIGRAYLVGFDNFRAAEGQTSRLGDSLWERNIYRHPRRQGDQPEEDYIMQHDIYSLGVCLLELGMWQSFVDYGSTEPGPRPSATLRLSPENPELHNADLLKNHLLTLARSVLPRRIGTKYSKVVETCLTCLDPENVDFGDEREFQDADGILVGVRYVEKVSSIFIAVNKKPLTIF
jgi:serine/threonine protein kinase